MENEEKYRTDLMDIASNSTNEIKLCASVENSLNNIALREGFLNYKIFKILISTNGGNYLGELYEIDIKGETKDGPKEINLFLKQIIPTEHMKSVLNIPSCYSFEAFFYTDLRNMFCALQEVANIPESERFYVARGYEESNEKAIILENLTKKGYKTPYRMDVVTLKLAEVSIKQLAKLHGLTFALEKDYLEKHIKTVKNPFNFNDTWKNFVERHTNITIKYFNPDTQKKIERFRHTMYENVSKYYAGDTSSVKCLCHGDFKINNLMTKENEDEETEVFIIDYQFSFYASPVLDLLNFIFTGTDGKFRKENMENLISLYHDTLAEFLKYFKLDINNIYPKKVFEKDLKENLDFGLMVALFILPFNFTVEEDVPDFGTNDVEEITMKMDDRYKDRITEIVEEYINWGTLK